MVELNVFDKAQGKCIRGFSKLGKVRGLKEKKVRRKNGTFKYAPLRMYDVTNCR
jgi:hypothetical protein